MMMKRTRNQLTSTPMRIPKTRASCMDPPPNTTLDGGTPRAPVPALRRQRSSARRFRAASRASHSAATAAIHRAADSSGSGRTLKSTSRPWRRLSTRPARSRTARCLITAGRLTGMTAARALALPSPRAASRSSTRRRVGSASAANSWPCSTAAAVISGGHPDGVLLELAELHPPALCVALEVLAPLHLRAVQHREAALDHAQARAVALGDEGELDPGRVAFGGVHAAGIRERRPAEREEALRLHRRDPPAG